MADGENCNIDQLRSKVLQCHDASEQKLAFYILYGLAGFELLSILITLIVFTACVFCRRLQKKKRSSSAAAKNDKKEAAKQV